MDMHLHVGIIRGTVSATWSMELAIVIGIHVPSSCTCIGHVHVGRQMNRLHGPKGLYLKSDQLFYTYMYVVSFVSPFLLQVHVRL